jgi:hypothetical protein
VRFDDDDAIEVDEAIDQLTELIWLPTFSPVREAQRAIVLPADTGAARTLRKGESPRRSLIILPDDVATLAPAPATPRARKRPKRAGQRTMQLSPFAARPARQRSPGTSAG